ncbi:hypothetical protein PF006_g24676 [Phytophthora fragariae]|uniref:Uncharacterized protein n=1 Tax=Phytophthora fragariae TaxID=53985 RepID=A0A6A3HZY5_9STRA|nr:hypothetical protein PF003_g37570 [Phytophthora fragariae]KAE8975047.1 hypothetical protein PF011_g24625 [Phytophthora fragariae]KAE9092500.1 hypothetical protein PF006_g24676 [Phytophthora fragariae]
MPRSVKVSPDSPGVTVKASDGRALTLRRGLTFLDRPTATAFFQDFAKAQGKRLVINKKKSGGAQYEYVCASRAPPCGFRIKLLKSRSAQSSHFFVSSFVAQHAPDCAGAPKLTVRQAAAALLADADNAPSSAAASVKELQERLQQTSGEAISARKAYRVRDRLLRLAAGQFTKGFQRLESLLRGFQGKNSGAHVAFEMDAASNVFKRAFLSHPFLKGVFAEQYDLQRTGSIELLLDSELEENHTVRAPVVARKRGRPKSKPYSTIGDGALITPAVASAILSGDSSILVQENSAKQRSCDQNVPPTPSMVGEVAPNMTV